MRRKDGAGPLQRCRQRPYLCLEITAAVLGILLLAAGLPPRSQLAIQAGTLALLLGTSTLVSRSILDGLGIFPAPASDNQASQEASATPGTGTASERDIGWLIGKLENILIPLMVWAGEYTALSFIFLAKSLIRREDISSGNTNYFLAGTLLNITYSVVLALLGLFLAGSNPLDPANTATR